MLVSVVRITGIYFDDYDPAENRCPSRLRMNSENGALCSRLLLLSVTYIEIVVLTMLYLRGWAQSQNRESYDWSNCTWIKRGVNSIWWPWLFWRSAYTSIKCLWWRGSHPISVYFFFKRPWMTGSFVDGYQYNQCRRFTSIIVYMTKNYVIWMPSHDSF